MKRLDLFFVALLFLAAPVAFGQFPPWWPDASLEGARVTPSPLEARVGDSLTIIARVRLFWRNPLPFRLTIKVVPSSAMGEKRGWLHGDTTFTMSVWWGGFIDSSTPYLYGVVETLGDFNQANNSLKVSLVSTRVRQAHQLPTRFALEQNYPNPFNPETAINYQLPVAGHVRLSIYTVLGQEVRRLVDRSQDAAYHVVVWDGRDNAGNTLPSGVYFYRLESGSFMAMKKMIMVR